jgi:hypothetical protein
MLGRIPTLQGRPIRQNDLTLPFLGLDWRRAKHGPLHWVRRGWGPPGYRLAQDQLQTP